MAECFHVHGVNVLGLCRDCAERPIPPKPEPPPAPPKKKLSENPRLFPEQSDISLRDLFAGLAVAGIMSEANGNVAPPNGIADYAYVIADCLLARRQR